MVEDRKLKENISNIKKKLMVISGKGGVGKTTIAVNLAYALSLKGYKVGLLDIDIHGPNVVKMLGIENKKITGSGDSRINPIKLSENLKVVSTASMLEDSDTPVIWRGPLKMKIISQFLGDVNWGGLDYLIIDSPPGTGDEPLSVAQLIEDLSGVIVVTTPQEVAMLDSRKSIQFARKLNIPYIGIIENMSGFTCPHCGKGIDLFNKGGGKKAADELGVDFLGDIPIDKEIVDLSDSGRVFVEHGNMDSAAFKKMEEVVKKIVSIFSPNKKNKNRSKYK
jgi:ATP-binding protein involved in chromosome partitioning